MNARNRGKSDVDCAIKLSVLIRRGVYVKSWGFEIQALAQGMAHDLCRALRT